MDWLNYHHFKYFWTVARLGSVSRASEELRLTQATVSAQLKSLEQALVEQLSPTHTASAPTHLPSKRSGKNFCASPDVT